MVPLAAAGGFAKAEPASGAVAGTKEAMGVDKGLYESWFVGVAMIPIVR